VKIKLLLGHSVWQTLVSTHLIPTDLFFAGLVGLEDVIKTGTCHSKGTKRESVIQLML